MKTKSILLGLGAAMLFAACTNDDSVTTATTGSEVIGSQVQVEASAFDWSTDKAVSVVVTSPVTSSVSIYADEACTNPIVTNKPVTANVANQIAFTVSQATERVYVSYPTATGSAVLTVSLTAVTSQKGHTPIPCILPENCVASTVANHAYTSYHSSGVIMMDASWPSVSPAGYPVISTSPKMYSIISGYNDLVVDYDIESNVLDPAATGYDFDSWSWREGVKVVLHIRALGSKLPERFGLKLENLDMTYVDSQKVAVTLGNYDAAPDGSITGKIISDGGHPVLMVDHLQWLLSPACTFNNTNASYYNVERKSRVDWLATGQDYINHGGKLFTITFRLNGKLRTKDNATSLSQQTAQYTAAVVQTDKQNFFMQTTGGNEIHLRGYAPLTTYSSTYTAAVNANYGAGGLQFLNKDAGFSYCTNWGYPWAFKVPVLTKHLYKDANMDQAYPDFNKWCVTSGAQCSDWYEPSKVDDTYIVKWW